MNEKVSLAKRDIRRMVTCSLDYSRDISDEELYAVIDEILLGYCKNVYLTFEEKQLLRGEIFSAIRGFDILDGLLEDESITEIMINGYRNVFVEREGKLERCDRFFESEEKLEDIIQQIAAYANRIVNESEPVCDMRLPDGSRVNVIMRPVAIEGPVVTIRKFSKDVLSLEELVKRKTLTEEAAGFLKDLVRAGYNIFISGGTGAGKTTLLNALSGCIPADERIITIEDSAELQIQNIDNLVRLEVRNKNVEGCRKIEIRDLIKAALRARPTRIIVGEIRGAEAQDMLQAMNTGHDGSISTGHANSVEDMITRLESMVMMGSQMPVGVVRQQISSAIEIFIHISRMPDGSRKVQEISELVRGEDRPKVRKIFCLTDGELRRVEKELLRNEKMVFLHNRDWDCTGA